MTAREAIGDAARSMQRRLDQVLDSEDAVIVMVNRHGATSYFQGFGASGCDYEPENIGAGDAPVSLIHSKGDGAVPYSCAAATVTAARAAGLVAELTSYCTSSLHAEDLYSPNKAVTDQQWTTFLARQLLIYSDMRPPSADPVCP